jgi:serine/threonine protein kinase
MEDGGSTDSSRRWQVQRHPSYEEQELLLNAVLARINSDSLTKLLSSPPLSMELLSWHRWVNPGGMVNPIFLLHVRDNNTGEEKELVLKVGNPHPYWKRVKMQSEVTALKFIEEERNRYNSELHVKQGYTPSDQCPTSEGMKEEWKWRQLCPPPVPRVYSFSWDTETSPLGCEYNLMDRKPGVCFEDLIDKGVVTDDDMRKVGAQVACVIEWLYHIPRSKMNFNKIGSLTERHEGGKFYQDGPPIGPFFSFLEMITAHIEYGIEAIESWPWLAAYRATLVPNLRRYLTYVKQLSPSDLEPERYYLIHKDLNASNILVDPETMSITAVVDWDSCRIAPFDEEAAWNNQTDKYERYICEELEKLGIHKPRGYDQRQKLHELRMPLQYMYTYASTFWEGAVLEGKTTTQILDIIARETKRFAKEVEKALQKLLD